MTAGHKVLTEDCESRSNQRCKIWPPNGCNHIRAKPILFGTGKSSRKFLDRSEKPNVMNTDNSLELGKACEALSWNHCKSTPHRSETNGVAERAVRRIKEGTHASGVANQAWTKNGGRIPWEVFAICGTYKTFFWYGKTPFERRCGEPFTGTAFSCGSMVEHHSISAKKNKSRLQQFGEKVFLGIILGYALYAGVYLERRHHGRRQRSLKIWTCHKFMLGDSNAKEVLMQKMLNFSCARSQMDQSKLSGRDQAFPEIHLQPGSPSTWRRAQR